MRNRLLIPAVFSLVCAWTSPSWAQSIVQHQKGTSTASAVTVAVSVTSTSAGNSLIACPANLGNRTVSGVTDNAAGGTNTYTQGVGSQDTQNNTTVGNVDCWYALNTSHGGATAITVTFSGAAGTFGKAVFFYEVAGFTTAAFDAAANLAGAGQGAGTTDTGAPVTTTSTKGFVVGIICSAAFVASNPASGNAFNAGGDTDGAVTGCAAASLISTTAAAHTPVWTDGASGRVFNSSTTAFKETAGGGGGTKQPPTQQMMGCCMAMNTRRELPRPTDASPVGAANEPAASPQISSIRRRPA
ncbi:MAG TPA: hypothetical protein VKG84_07140 [Candidatus Acidoferrales bacterium]|nr:hypothetical protein [Candidatus Acidoferrales bacterium]